MFKRYKSKMFCFSPPVMLATFLFEFGAAFYTIWRYKMTTVTRLAVMILLALGTFQLAEYMICGGLGWTNVEWARLGYASITVLPPLGIHMLVALSGKKKPLLVSLAYVTGAAFLAFYVFVQSAIGAQECHPNYAVFHTSNDLAWLYGVYYYGWLVTGTLLAVRWAGEMPKRKKALMGMAFGYLVFIIPTTFFNLVDPSTIKGIPSIMCGFAVLLAAALIFIVLPNSSKKR